MRGQANIETLAQSFFSWVVDTFFADSDLAKALGLGINNQKINGSSNVIDVEAFSDANRKLSESDPSKRR